MNGARVFEDAYSGVFREQEDFFSCLHEIMGKSLWIRQKVRNLRLVPIIAGSTFEKELRSQYTEDGMDDGIIYGEYRHRLPYGRFHNGSYRTPPAVLRKALSHIRHRSFRWLPVSEPCPCQRWHR